MSKNARMEIERKMNAIANTSDGNASHRLIELRVAGGFLDPLHIQFSPGHNCIIGGRGAGKTTYIYAAASLTIRGGLRFQ